MFRGPKYTEIWWSGLLYISFLRFLGLCNSKKDDKQCLVSYNFTLTKKNDSRKASFVPFQPLCYNNSRDFPFASTTYLPTFMDFPLTLSLSSSILATFVPRNSAISLVSRRPKHGKLNRLTVSAHERAGVAPYLCYFSKPHNIYWKLSFSHDNSVRMRMYYVYAWCASLSSVGREKEEREGVREK